MENENWAWLEEKTEKKMLFAEALVLKKEWEFMKMKQEVCYIYIFYRLSDIL